MSRNFPVNLSIIIFVWTIWWWEGERERHDLSPGEIFLPHTSHTVPDGVQMGKYCGLIRLGYRAWRVTRSNKTLPSDWYISLNSFDILHIIILELGRDTWLGVIHISGEIRRGADLEILNSEQRLSSEYLINIQCLRGARGGLAGTSRTPPSNWCDLVVRKILLLITLSPHNLTPPDTLATHFHTNFCQQFLLPGLLETFLQFSFGPLWHCSFVKL